MGLVGPLLARPGHETRQALRGVLGGDAPLGGGEAPQAAKKRKKRAVGGEPGYDLYNEVRM